MGKKRKASGRQAEEEVPGLKPRGGKMKAITSYEDVADSEDEFHMQREKIMLDEGPEAKRRRKWEEEDALLEPSDEEILAYSESEDEDEEEDDEPSPRRKTNGKQVSDSEREVEEEEEEEEGWGTSRKDYYNNDEIETEADALEEEAEAKRLQQKKLQKMSEADFGFDESEWLDAETGEDDGDVVTEVLKDVEITADMGKEDRLRILQTRYPEFDFLANELLQLQPKFVKLQAQATHSPVAIAKSRALAAYNSSLTMYFAILTSPAKGAQGAGKTLDPAELRDHAVMDSILQCRGLWSKVKNLKAPAVVDVEEDISMEEYPETNGIHQEIPKPKKKSKKELARLEAVKSASAQKARNIAAAEAELASLDTLITKPKKASKKPKIVSRSDSDSDSDFGEETTMDAKSAAEKEKKKKSLRFYTSQIAQKANKRAGAGRDAGGDEDLPHRERLRDRQERLNAEAEKRGKKLDEYGRGGASAAAIALGGESGSDEEDGRVAADVREEGDEYYDMIAQTADLKKLDKEARNKAIAQAKAEGGLVRVVEGEVDENGKRAIGYVIQKNKGLAPKRKKDVRNPRVKKRKKYEEKKKKLASSRATYKGGEERGGYGGEKTGIKTGLVKSIKL